MITKTQLLGKRYFDLILALFLLPLILPVVILLVFFSTIDTWQWGVFSQKRVGQHGKLFNIYKIRTLKKGNHVLGHLDLNATHFGRFLRNTKLDELPQIINVLIGEMSFVGPRPDVEGFADLLKGNDRIILKLKPGITGPATIKYRNEESILAKQSDPEHYNRNVIWVDKVEINKKYILNYSFYLDLSLIIKSLFN